MNPYLRLMRIDKPIGTYLVLWPTLWALWLAAGGLPHWHVLFIFLLGVFLMRSAGCVINDIADRNFDVHVTRTKQRPLPQGEVSIKMAWKLFVALSLLAFSLVLFLNMQTILLSFFAIVIASVYPFTKRFFIAPQFVLSLAFAWAVPMAFAAEGMLSLQTWILFSAVICWVIAYDTMYAMVDREDDRRLPIQSTALWFGRFDRCWIALFQLTFLGFLVWLGLLSHLSFLYFFSLALVGCLFIYQQKLIFSRKPSQCFRAFENNRWVGLVIFVGILAGQIFLS